MIDTQEIISQTTQLVSIPSTSDNPNALRQAVDFVADFVTSHADVTIERFEQNGITSFLAYRGAERPQTFDVLLNGHVDVVPGTPEQFIPYVEDGKLYGRGVLDMKGTTMALAAVFCELVNKVPYSLGLEIVSDEESGGYNGVRHHVAEGVRAHFAVMGEYSNHRDAIYNAARGLCWIDVAFKGISAHGGHPWHGDNALLRASTFIDTLLQRYPIPAEESWTTTATIASVSTPNDSYNRVPDYAVVKIDFRFTNDDPVFKNEASLRAFIAQIDPEAELIHIDTFHPAVHASPENAYVKSLSNAMAKATDIEPRLMARPASSDARYFAEVDVPCVEFGLYGHNSHSNDEFVDLESFEEYVTILRTFLNNPKA